MRVKVREKREIEGKREWKVKKERLWRGGGYKIGRERQGSQSFSVISTTKLNTSYHMLIHCFVSFCH